MAHEDLKPHAQPERSSDRSFGLVFAVLFAVVASAPLRHGQPVHGWSAGVAFLFVLAAWLRPVLLSPLNKAWMQFGRLLSAVVSPIALAVLFFAVVTPIAALMRLSGKDSLRLKFEPSSDSYWIRREPPGPKPDSLGNQF